MAGHLAAFVVEDTGSRLTERQILHLMCGWNSRNNPPLSDHELGKAVKSAFKGNGKPRKDKLVKRWKPKRACHRADERRRVPKHQSSATTDDDLLGPTPQADGQESQQANRRRKSSDRRKRKQIVVAAARLAAVITARDHFARDVGGLLYVFHGGVYVPRGELHVKQQVKHILWRAKQSDDWHKRLAEEVTEYIAVDAPELWEQRHPRLLNVSNGLLDMSTRKLTSHSPEYLSPIQLPILFDPSARCEFSERFYADVFPADSTELAWE